MRWWRGAVRMAAVTSEDRDSEVDEDFNGCISYVISDVADRWGPPDAASAVAHLSTNLSHVGLHASDEWCRAVLETLWRGEPLTIEVD